MKRILLFFALAAIIANAYTQVAISTNGSSPNASAMLDVVSTEKGLLIPRMIMTERDVIDLPADGLLIYQTDNTPGFYFYDGSSWEIVATGAMEINNLADGKTNNSSVFLGLDAGANENTMNRKNVAIGIEALNTNTSGYCCTATGYKALYSNTIGYRNSANGYEALYSNTIGNFNIAIGYKADYYNETGSNNTIIGFEAGKGTALHNKSGNIFLGCYAGYSETGDNKLYIDNSTTAYPLIYGEFDNNLLRVNGTLHINNSYQFPTTDGSSGQILQTDGSGVLSWNNDAGATEINDLTDGKTGGNSVFLGSGAGANDDGSTNQNVAVGIDAFNTNTTGFGNSATGYRALYSNLGGSYNVANGYCALNKNSGGSNNSAMGDYSLYKNLSGNLNAAVGHYSLYNNTEGNNNIAMGDHSLFNNTTGSNNTAVGNYAFVYGANYSNATALGYNADPGASNKVAIGNSSVTWIGGQVTWSTYSDARAKSNVEEDVVGLDFIMGLRPVTYYFEKDEMDCLIGKDDSSDYAEKYDIEKIKQSGFLAQEVEKAAIMAGYDFSGIKKPKDDSGYYSLSYSEFVVPLVSGMQEQQRVIENQQQDIDELKKLNAVLLNRIEKLEKK